MQPVCSGHYFRVYGLVLNKRGQEVQLEKRGFWTPLLVRDGMLFVNVGALRYPAHWFVDTHAPCSPKRIPGLEILSDEGDKPLQLPFINEEDFAQAAQNQEVEGVINLLPFQEAALSKFQRGDPAPK